MFPLAGSRELPSADYKANEVEKGIIRSLRPANPPCVHGDMESHRFIASPLGKVERSEDYDYQEFPDPFKVGRHGRSQVSGQVPGLAGTCLRTVNSSMTDRGPTTLAPPGRRHYDHCSRRSRLISGRGDRGMASPHDGSSELSVDERREVSKPLSPHELPVPPKAGASSHRWRKACFG